MSHDDAYNDVRMTAADSIREVGYALQRAAQALEQSELGCPPREEWEQAARNFETAMETLGECEQICRKQMDRP